MKYLSVILSVLLLTFALCACTSDSREETPNEAAAQETDDKNTQESNGKILVAYFSATGNTKAVAEKTAELTNADIFEIVPSVPYTEADLNYGDDNSRTTAEQNDDSARPEIAGKVENMEDYDTVFIGYPIWWGQAPKIMYTFLEGYDFNGKTIIPFCTSGSSPIGSSAENMRSLTTGADWLEGQRFEGGASEDEISKWIDTLRLD